MTISRMIPAAANTAQLAIGTADVAAVEHAAAAAAA
eukprot:CAMPEP_0185835594 /NCGR_PEP_ID=MMETSP1353-20130828/8096_1 /TAXON_ID=1077150 /ORGANISM="Erythrolobus australicus, Strain CCMP3124" /LENGTH=35 /DNA_ID= /DNA_START= /DNA_END= /DNA_ORIENTATION=